MDRREVFPEERLAERGRIEQHEVQPVLLHLEIDGARHDVARCELGPFVVGRHEARAMGRIAVGGVGQTKHRPFAAQRLRDQEAALVGVIETGRVELDELHVGHATAGAPGHRDAVAGGGVGIGRIAIDLADAAGREDDRRRDESLDMTGAHVERIQPFASARRRGHHEVDGHDALAQRHVRMSDREREQRLVDGSPGRIGRMRDAAHAMPALARQVQAERAADLGGERHAHVDQPFDRRAAAFGDEARRVLVDETGAGLLGIVDMGIDAVVRRDDADDAALRPCGRAFGEAALGEHHDAPARRETEGGGQAGESRTDDDDGRWIFLHGERPVPERPAGPAGAARQEGVPSDTVRSR